MRLGGRTTGYCGEPGRSGRLIDTFLRFVVESYREWRLA